MNVLVINSSPRHKLSLTKKLLTTFSEGIIEEGGHVTTFDLYRTKFMHCTACSSCYTNSQGECILKDDMSAKILPEFLKADLLVLGTPIYFGNLNAAMKDFIERLLPFLDSRQEVLEDGSFHHPYREQFPKTILFSVAGWEKEHAFQHISSYFRWLLKDRLIAEIYRGTSDLLSFCDSYEDTRNEIYAAVKLAGKQMVKYGEIPLDLIQVISQDIADLDLAVGAYNLFVSSCKLEDKTLMQWVAKGRITRPSSIDNLITMMRLSFNSTAAGDKNFKVQFVFNGSVEGRCYVYIHNGELLSGEGEIDDPSIIIKAPFDLWVDILHGNANMQQELMQGKLFIKGDFSTILKMGDVFSGKSKVLADV